MRFTNRAAKGDCNSRALALKAIFNTCEPTLGFAAGGKPLDNDKIYAVAIAAIDQFGNVGPLSSVFCEKPERTTDFWENYKNAGGEAGGGFCSVEGAGLPVGSLTVTGIMAVALVGAIRRRRERAVSNPRDERDNRSGR